MDLSNFLVNPLTLALIILGVVEMIKKLGVRGNKLMLISMAVGFLFALLYKVRELYEPSVLFIDVAFFGIAAGLGASGIYSFINDRFPTAQNNTPHYTIMTSRTIPNVRADDIFPDDQEVL